MGTVLDQIPVRKEVIVFQLVPFRVILGRFPCVARLKSAICSHPSKIWITVALGESLIRARKSLAPVVGRPWSQVTSCKLSRRPSPRIANVFAACSPISVVVLGICSFLSVGTRSHKRLMSLRACDFLFMAPELTYMLCNLAWILWEILISLNICPP